MQSELFDEVAFGIRLRQARKEAGMSQAELATRIGVYQPWISELEHGNQGPVSANTLMQLARALSVTTDALLGLTDAPARRRRQRQEGGV